MEARYTKNGKWFNLHDNDKVDGSIDTARIVDGDPIQDSKSPEIIFSKNEGTFGFTRLNSKSVEGEDENILIIHEKDHVVEITKRI